MRPRGALAGIGRCVAILVALCSLSAGNALGERILPLTSVALVGDLDAKPDKDDPGTGGGFETSSYFQTRLTDSKAIAACAAGIEGAASAWATSLGLNRNLRDRDTDSLSLHYTKPGLAGFFNVSYRVLAGVRSRVRVDFYLLDGSPQAPESARELLEPYKIAALEDALDQALHCGGAAP